MTSAERRIDGSLLALAMLGSGALSLWFGQDFNADQTHYHYYLGWSLLAGRLDRDIAPAGIGTYLNPVLHVPTYLGVTYLPPRLFGSLLGAVHGLNAFLAYRLAAYVLEGRRWRLAMAAVAGWMVALGPEARTLLGTTFGDNLASVPAMAALLLLVSGAARGQISGSRVVLIGVLAGVATGLKLTLVVFHIALAAAVAVLSFRNRSVRLPLAFVLGSLLGGLASGGYWAWQLWQRFGNPVFPLANAVFKSPFHQAANFRDGRFQTRGIRDLWQFPADMAVGQTRRFQEIAFRDPRYLVLLGAAVGAFLHLLLRRRFERPAGSLAAALVLVYWFTAYVTWLRLFCYHRYFAMGEFVAPVAVLALLVLVFRSRLAPTWLALAAVVVLGAAGRGWGRIPWAHSWYNVRLPTLAAERGAAVIVDGAGMSYVLPSFPPEDRFFSVWQLAGFTPLVERQLREHEGPIFRLTRGDQPPTPGMIEQFDLLDTGDCEMVKTRVFRMGLCRLSRIPTTGPGPAPAPSSARR